MGFGKNRGRIRKIVEVRDAKDDVKRIFRKVDMEKVTLDKFAVGKTGQFFPGPLEHILGNVDADTVELRVLGQETLFQFAGAATDV